MSRLVSSTRISAMSLGVPKGRKPRKDTVDYDCQGEELWYPDSMDGDGNRRVDLVRVPREETYYAAEDVFGRDASSVFPTEHKKAMLESEPVKAFLGGNKKFISETELQEIKAVTGGKGRVEDDSVASNKPLAEILREQKEAKDAKFQDQWKQMKTFVIWRQAQGKNRPLDEEEYVFLDRVAKAEAARVQQMAEQEQQELNQFHQALRDRQKLEAESKNMVVVDRSGGQAAKATSNSKEGTAGVHKKGGREGAAAVVKVKARIIKAVQSQTSGKQKQQKSEDIDTKRQKMELGNTRGDDETEGDGLAGLLGAYGSDSD